MGPRFRPVQSDVIMCAVMLGVDSGALGTSAAKLLEWDCATILIT